MTYFSSWTVRGNRQCTFPPSMLMGIVNLTPDSFSDGGTHYGADIGGEDTLAHCYALVRQGAAILDIGGESTRPGAELIETQAEIDRVLPTLHALQACRDTQTEHSLPEMENILISVDTWRGQTAHVSLEAGVDIINDISGGIFDPAILDIVAEYKPGYVLGHCPEDPKIMQSAPRYDNVVDDIYSFFSERLSLLEKKGLPGEYVILDPCVGFGKNLQHNLEILRGLDRFRSLGRPLLIGLSRKRLFGELLGIAEPLARDTATQVATALLAERNVEVHRVHDVRGAAQALAVTEALRLNRDSQVEV